MSMISSLASYPPSPCPDPYPTGTIRGWPLRTSVTASSLYRFSRSSLLWQRPVFASVLRVECCLPRVLPTPCQYRRLSTAYAVIVPQIEYYLCSVSTVGRIGGA
eukprot:726432-Rhodomonas_salina.2